MHVFTTQNWDQEVLRSDVPVLVDFWGPSCAPCIAIAPLVDRVSQQSAETLKVGKVNVNLHAQLASKYGVRSIPTLLLFRKGKVVGQKVGMLQEKELLTFVQKVLR